MKDRLAGYLTDAILSKSRPFILCLTTLHASTLLFFLGSRPSHVLTARALQGASQAFVWVSGMALLASRVDEADRLGLFVGYLFMAGTIGELVGPVIGGPLYEGFGHWAVFVFVEVLLGVDVGLRVAVGDKSDRGVVKTASVQENCQTETDALLHQQNPEVIITNNLHWNCLASITAETIATIPLVVLSRFAWSPSASGAVLFALILPSVLGPVIGRFAARHGPRWWNVAALAACGSCTAGLALVSGEAPFVLLVAGIGFCVTAIINANTASVLAVARSLDRQPAVRRPLGVTTGSLLGGLNTAWSLGLEEPVFVLERYLRCHKW
ncbi:hypothetical protein CDD80_1112 [Ophiocordyceps camponoti-rufipedis]|uniref:Major facilitator superfamily (MFS) profile domain-containing protein n=1 Tax=Ophiocordyceps camponoti-rufipedis TaxID=2004952 RepID=A0A2C5YA37_9HYPO|nr:hypothetical protein CDD80_1112 [Ophiocordyceps camponoti-rufipedis]